MHWMQIITESELLRLPIGLHICIYIYIGSPPMSSTALVTINVQDLNDNNPEFSKSVHEVTILQAEAIPGMTVIHLKATDLDSGQNGMITYSLQDDFEGSYGIDSITGNLFVKTIPSPGHYEVVVQATDKGRIPLSGQTTVSVQSIGPSLPITTEPGTTVRPNKARPQCSKATYNVLITEELMTSNVIQVTD